MDPLSDSLDTFFAAWEVDNTDARRALLEEATGARLFYLDPNASKPITSLAAMNDYLAMFNTNMPGASAAVVNCFEHNGYARATVAFRKEGTTMMHGQYFADLDSTGRITRLIGFPGMGEPE